MDTDDSVTSATVKYFPQTFPTLRTKDLLLRRFTTDDSTQAIIILNDVDITKNLEVTPYPFTADHYSAFLKKANDGFDSKTCLRFAIAKNDLPDKMIGLIGLYMNKYNEVASVCYYLEKPYWGKGYMTQALKEVIEYGFKVLHLHKIGAEHYASNIGSGKVMEKCGMTKEILQKHQTKRFGVYNDVYFYAIINDEKADSIAN